MRILVVEDDKMIREGISEYLSESGYIIIEAKDLNLIMILIWLS